MRSQARRDEARYLGICILCFKRPMTPGTHGPSETPYSTCRTCRVKKRQQMAERRA